MQEEQINIKLRDLKKKRYETHAHQKASFKKLFQSNIEVNYKDPEIISMISKGIPSVYRAKIWPKLVQNVHGITLNFYQILLKKANVFINVNEKQVSPERKRMVQQLNIIEKDIERTFPELKVFRKDSDQGQYLFNILTSWTVFRQDIGYMQGMSQIAGMLLLQLKETQSFPIFCSMMTSDILYTYYTMEIDEMKKIQQKFEFRVRRGDQKLYNKLKEYRVDTRVFLLNWIMTLFTRAMDLDLVGRLWDIILCYELSQKIIIQVCYYLLVIFKHKIMDQELQGQQISSILKSSKVPEVDGDQLLDNIRSIFFR